MQISLILCTLGRREVVDKFLDSISRQTLKPREIIIVDQNPEGFLDSVVQQWQSNLPIRHYRVNFKGVSRARNYGASLASCEIISFPDDDCLYVKDTISRILNCFTKSINIDIVIGGKISSYKDQHSFPLDNSVVKVRTFLDLLKSKAETSQIFFRKEFIIELLPNLFDENIGPGSNGDYISNEETDLLFRAIRLRKNIFHKPEIRIIHHSSQVSFHRALGYGIGRFRIIQKYKLGAGYYFLNLLQPFVRLINHFSLRNLSLCIATVIGRSGITLILQEIRAKLNKSN